MMRGCEKRVVHIKNPNDPHFEEVYLFLKENVSPVPSKGDLWREAEKIIERCTLRDSVILPPPPRKADTGVRALYFSAGALIGAFVATLAFLLF